MEKNNKKKHNTLPLQHGRFNNPFIQKSKDLISELSIANKAIADQLIEKKMRQKELVIAQKELVFKKRKG